MLATNSLRGQITQIAAEAETRAVAVACFDLRHKTEWSLHGERWFHAASTIKVPVLLGVFAAIEKGQLTEFSRIHIRNRFQSIADGAPFHVDMARDSTPDVYGAIGKTMQVRELARHMIVTSSNLATNLLVDIVGIEAIKHTIRALHLDHGIDFQRGVEDNLAWEQGINNRVTANGLLEALRMIAEERAISGARRRHRLLARPGALRRGHSDGVGREQRRTARNDRAHFAHGL